MSDWLTCADVAEDLHVHLTTVVRWVKAGKLPAMRLPGGHLRIRAADYAGWQREHMVEVPESLSTSGLAVSDTFPRPHEDGPTPLQRPGPDTERQARCRTER